jgi:hypothetical protein
MQDLTKIVLTSLDYTTLDHSWIKRTEYDSGPGRRTVTERTFDLHVICSTPT